MAMKREAKEKAQEMLMHGIGDVLGYWFERTPDSAKNLGLTEEEFSGILFQQADRIARLFGYDRAWGN